MAAECWPVPNGEHNSHAELGGTTMNYAVGLIYVMFVIAILIIIYRRIPEDH